MWPVESLTPLGGGGKPLKITMYAVRPHLSLSVYEVLDPASSNKQAGAWRSWSSQNFLQLEDLVDPGPQACLAVM